MVARAIHDGFQELCSLGTHALAYWGSGSYTQALQTVREGMAKAREWDNPLHLGRLTHTLGWFHRELGDVARALAYDQESADLGRRHGV